MNEENTLIRTARLRMSSPETVYRQLEHLATEHAGSWTSVAWEKDLLARNDPLIDLGLARFGFDADIVATLYQRARAGTVNSNDDFAVRIACLSNRTCPFYNELAGIDGQELARLARDGSPPELEALLSNPARRWLVSELYNRADRMADLPLDRWLAMVQASVANDAIEENRDSDEGPDAIHRRIQQGVLFMLRTAPVEAPWLDALYQLMLKVDPEDCIAPDSLEQVHGILDRWKDLKLTNRFSKDQEEQRGSFSGLSRVDEFRSVIAALYGRLYAGGKATWLAGADHPNPVYRCAFYGRSQLTVESIKAVPLLTDRAWGAWLLAMLLNPSLYGNSALRAEVEPLLPRAHAREYLRRCGQIRHSNEWFDPRPVSPKRVWDQDEVVAATGDVPRVADARDVKQLMGEVAALRANLAAVARTVGWLTAGLAVTIVLLLWRR